MANNLQAIKQSRQLLFWSVRYFVSVICYILAPDPSTGCSFRNIRNSAPDADRFHQQKNRYLKESTGERERIATLVTYAHNVFVSRPRFIDAVRQTS